MRSAPLFEIYCELEDIGAIQSTGSKMIMMLIRQNDLSQIKDIYRHMRSNPEPVYPVPEAFFNMGVAFEKAGEIDNAYRLYEKFMDQYPEHALAAKSLVKLAKYNLEDRENYEEAYYYYAEAKRHPATDINLTKVIEDGIRQVCQLAGPQATSWQEADRDLNLNTAHSQK